MLEIAVQYEPWIWVGCAMIFLIAELFTGGLYLIPFSVGSGSAAILSFASRQPLGVQIGLFCLVSLVMFFAMRPLSEHLTQNADHRFNVDRLIGMPGLVTETINTIQATGQVQVKGEVWNAASQDHAIIPAGTPVEIQRVDGTSLVVTPSATPDTSD